MNPGRSGSAGRLSGIAWPATLPGADQILPALRLAAVAFIGLWFVRYGLLEQWTADGYGYWLTRSGPLYDIPWNSAPEAYVYAPAFAQAIRPLTVLPWEAFFAVLTAAQLAALVWLAGPILAAVLLIAWFPLWSTVIASGNIQVLMAAALVIGTRYPAAWAFLLLTKVTPGVGLVWYLARREWRSLAVALGATLAITVVSFALWPSAWFEWIGSLVGNVGAPVPEGWSLLPIGLPVRMAGAAVLIAYGARREWWWTVPVGVTLAQPIMGWSTLTILLALVPTVRSRFP